MSTERKNEESKSLRKDTRELLMVCGMVQSVYERMPGRSQRQIRALMITNIFLTLTDFIKTLLFVDGFEAHDDRNETINNKIKETHTIITEFCKELSDYVNVPVSTNF